MENGIGCEVDFCDARKQWCCVCKSGVNFVDSAKEISESMSGNGENTAEDLTMKMEALKTGKNEAAKRVSWSGCWRKWRRWMKIDVKKKWKN